MIDRYTRPEIGALFTDKHKFDMWLKVELAVCEAWAKEGKIPSAAYNRIKKKARFKLKRIEDVEAEVHHDVIAFTTAVGDYIGDDSAYFHKGLTSSDVVDTAQNLVLKQAGQLLEIELDKLREAVGKRALEHKHTPAMGRTHGVHAEPTTFGLKMLIWYDELTRHEERLAQAIDNLAVGKLSGAVGNFAHIPPAFEMKILKNLGLEAAPVSNQIVQRDRHAQFVCTLAQLAATMEKIAVNLRTYQRTEIGEVQEAFAKGQKGSSAMPHKKNPILLERVTGLARVMRGYALTSLENVALWDERDISHSGAERIILGDSCILCDYMLAKLTSVVERLEIRPRRLERNIYFTKGLIFSQRVLLALTEAGLSREQAYPLVQRNALRCWEDETPFMDALLGDRDVRAVLDAKDITALFELAPFLAHVDELFERVGLVVKPRANQGKPSVKSDKRSGQERRTRRPQSKVDKKVGDVKGGGGLDSIEVASGAIQNIGERAADYYESVQINRDYSGRPDEGSDETLGEPQHEKEVRQRRVAVAKSRSAKAPARRRRTTRKPETKDPEGAAPRSEQPNDEKLKEEKTRDEKSREDKVQEAKPKAAKPRRRTRKPKKVESVKPSSNSDDDSYVD